jgi:hypothetical protein
LLLYMQTFLPCDAELKPTHQRDESALLWSATIIGTINYDKD